MRVYEFSRTHNISNKVLLDTLEKGGFDVGSHMRQLTAEQVSFLLNTLNLNEVEAVSSAQKAKGVDVPASPKSLESDIDKTKKKVVSRHESDAVKSKTKMTEKSSGGIVLQDTSLGDLAEQLSIAASELIILLLKEGVVCNKNQILPKEIVEKIVRFYGKEIDEPVVEAVAEEVVGDEQRQIHERPPVVVVIGHVDHGKTTLLDYIRNTRVATREKGGITQHIGAYQANTKHGDVVFIDTPGHEAFTKMRLRGVKVADIAILIIAADDGVMPQTVEAIRHAKSLDVPIIVAINKIDKVDASRLEVIKGQLAQHDLLSEDWGGQITVVPVSAKEGLGVDHLLELIVLQAQLMELKTDLDVPAKGFVLESRLEKGRGAVATIINKYGILRVGDYFVCGKTTGRVTSLVDSFGKQVASVDPTVPVRVSGLDELAQVGDFLQVVSPSEYKRVRSKKGRHKAPPVSHVLFSDKAIPFVIKADTHSSREALLDSIERLVIGRDERDKDINIVHAGVGDINESDIILAASVGARVIGFHVKLDPNAVILSQKEKIKVSLFEVIYKLLEFISDLKKAEVVAQVSLVKTGEAIVRKVFDIKKIGVVAGSYVKDGVFSRDGIAKVWRRNKLLAEGPIKSLQRDKRAVKEVNAGYECGFLVEGFNDFQIDDRVECFVKKTV